MRLRGIRPSGHARRLDELARPPARLGVHRVQILEVAGNGDGNRVERSLHDLRDGRERDLTGEERAHRHLVGSVQDTRRRAPALARLPGQAQARERVGIGLREGELAGRREIKGGHLDVRPVALQQSGERGHALSG